MSKKNKDKKAKEGESEDDKEGKIDLLPLRHTVCAIDFHVFESHWIRVSILLLFVTN